MSTDAEQGAPRATPGSRGGAPPSRIRSDDPMAVVLDSWLELAGPWAEALRTTRLVLLRAYESRLDRAIGAGLDRVSGQRRDRSRPGADSPPDKPRKAA